MLLFLTIVIIKNNDAEKNKMTNENMDERLQEFDLVDTLELGGLSCSYALMNEGIRTAGRKIHQKYLQDGNVNEIIIVVKRNPDQVQMYIRRNNPGGE